MKKLLLILFFFSFGLSAEPSKSKIIKNLDITVTGEYKVEIYKDEKHMFSFDCRPYMICEIFTTTKVNPSYKLLDGSVHSSDDLKSLTIDNGVMHMIDLAKTPMIVLFGPTNSEKFVSIRENIDVLDSKEIYNSSDITKITTEDVLNLI